MTEAWMEIRHNEKVARPLFNGDLGLREAIQTYVRLRWPSNTAKMAAKEWDLTIDEAKGLVAGRTSIATLDKILHHRRGGWIVGLQLLAAVIGYAVQAFFTQEKERLAHEAEHARRAADAAAELDRRAGRAIVLQARDAWAGLAGRRVAGAARRSWDSDEILGSGEDHDTASLAAPARGGRG